MMHLTRDAFAAWLGRYIEAWSSRDADLIGDLFSADCSYSYPPHDTAVGREDIIRAWLEEDEGPWEAHYEPLAIDEQIHVAIGWTRYFDEASNVRDEYSNIFVCRFDDDGRCTEFREWFMPAPGPIGRLD